MSNFHSNRNLFLQQSNSAYQIKLMIIQINMEVALYRELLIYVGQPRDCPEMREKIRQLRRRCLANCHRVCALLVPELQSDAMEESYRDNPNLNLFFHTAQQFQKEVTRGYHIIQTYPLDMSGYYDNRPGPSNIGNVISQILLCKSITPDFNEEELYSIEHDANEITTLLNQLRDLMPMDENKNLEKRVALQGDNDKTCSNRRRRNSLYENMSFFCCIRRNNYL